MRKDELYEKIKTILVEEFEIEESSIFPEATLLDDMDLDSIDFVDLVVKAKSIVSGKVTPDVFKNVKTMQDIVDRLYVLV